MIIERCDRCGKEKRIKVMPFGLNTKGDESKEAPGSWLKYSIIQYIYGEGEMLHLCEDCTKKMSEFMDEINAEKRKAYRKEQEAQE